MNLPILMYHEVAPEAASGYAKYTVRPRAFAAQMTYLRVAGYRAVTLDDVVEHQKGLRRLPRNSVAITFDDGYAACARYVAPILAKRGFRATFFLVAGLVGQTSRWLLRSHGFELPLMDWAMARNLEADGHQCESHGLTHPHFDALTADECRDELEGSRIELEHRLGHRVRHLAYPFGATNSMVVRLVRAAGYESACTVRVGRVAPSDSALELPRIPVTGFDSLPDFICRLRTGRSLRDLVNARFCRVRGRAFLAGTV